VSHTVPGPLVVKSGWRARCLGVDEQLESCQYLCSSMGCLVFDHGCISHQSSGSSVSSVG
jgi:hypothetical protein